MIKKLALGTVQFGMDYGIANDCEQVQLKEAKRILHYSKKSNIDTLDTASAYGDSEKILGKIGVDHYEVITKTIALKDSINDVIDGFYNSLENLKKNKVEGLLIHNIDDISNNLFDNLFKKLKSLQNQGLIDKVGFSVYSPEQVNYLLNNFKFDLIQLPLNVFDTRLIEGGQLKALKNKNIEIHSRSVFLQGLLVNFNNLPDYFSTWKKQFEEYKIIVDKSKLSFLEYALNFVLNVEEIDKVLVGVNSALQLREVIEAVKIQNYLKPYPINDEKILNPSLWKI